MSFLNLSVYQRRLHVEKAEAKAKMEVAALIQATGGEMVN